MCAVVAPEGIAGDSEGGAAGASGAAAAAILEGDVGDVGDLGGSEGSLIAEEAVRELLFLGVE